MLTFERMLAVKKPIYYSRIKLRSKLFISIILLVFAASVVVMLHFVVQDDELEYLVTPGIIFTTDFLALICYLVIRKTSKGELSSNHSTRNNNEKRFMLFCIKSFILFLVGWLPLAVFEVLFSSGIFRDWKYMLELRFTTHVMAFLNSVASCFWHKIKQGNECLQLEVKKVFSCRRAARAKGRPLMSQTLSSQFIVS